MNNETKKLIREQKEARLRGEAQMRKHKMWETVKRNVADDRYMETPKFYKDAITYQKKRGTYRKVNVKELKESLLA